MLLAWAQKWATSSRTSQLMRTWFMILYWAGMTLKGTNSLLETLWFEATWQALNPRTKKVSDKSRSKKDRVKSEIGTDDCMRLT
jgi:hypothetical protein